LNVQGFPVSEHPHTRQSQFSGSKSPGFACGAFVELEQATMPTRPANATKTNGLDFMTLPLP
jgi:hypothetical protein